MYHAGTKLSETGEFLTAGGRVLGITASAEKLRDALSAAYEAPEQVTFENVHYRRDIGQRALAAKK